MDRLLIALLFAFTALSQDIRAQDADWSGMVVYGKDKDKDKDDKKPVVPEPAHYGLFLVGASLAWCLVRRTKRSDSMTNAKDETRREMALSVRSTICDSYRSCLHRFVRPFFVFLYKPIHKPDWMPYFAWAFLIFFKEVPTSLLSGVSVRVALGIFWARYKKAFCSFGR